MKKAILLLTILLVAIGITLHVTATEIEYTSRVTQDNCVLCKDQNSYRKAHLPRSWSNGSS